MVGYVLMPCRKADLNNIIVPARFWQAIRRPPMLDLDVKVDDIKRALHEVVLEGHTELLRSHFEYVEAERKTPQHLIEESEFASSTWLNGLLDLWC